MRTTHFCWLVLGVGVVLGCGDDDGGGGGGTGGATAGSGGSATGGSAGSGGSATGGGAGSGGSATGGSGGTGGTGGSGTGGSSTGGASGWSCVEQATSCGCNGVAGVGGAPSCTKSYPCCYTYNPGQYLQCQCQQFTGNTCDIAMKAVTGTKVAKCPP